MLYDKSMTTYEEPEDNDRAEMPWTWTDCETNTCTRETCDGPEAHGQEA